MVGERLVYKRRIQNATNTMTVFRQDSLTAAARHLADGFGQNNRALVFGR